MKGKKASMAIALIGMSKRILIAFTLTLLSFQAVNADDWWKDGQFWIGTRLGPSFNFGGDYGYGDGYHDYPYSSGPDIDKAGGATFNMAASFGWQLAKAFALQSEFMFDRGEINTHWKNYYSGGRVDNEEKITISYSSLTIPVLAKLTFRPGICTIGIFAGPCFTLPLGDADWEIAYSHLYWIDDNAGILGTWTYTGSAKTRITFPVSLALGLDFGVKLGPGALFADARFAFDLGNVTIGGVTRDGVTITTTAPDGWEYKVADRFLQDREIKGRSNFAVTLGYTVSVGGIKPSPPRPVPPQAAAYIETVNVPGMTQDDLFTKIHIWCLESGLYGVTPDREQGVITLRHYYDTDWGSKEATVYFYVSIYAKDGQYFLAAAPEENFLFYDSDRWRPLDSRLVNTTITAEQQFAGFLRDALRGEMVK